VGGIAHHVSREARAGDRGHALGRARSEAVALTVTTYRRLLREAAAVGPSELRRAGADVAERLEPRWPELLDELEGIAAGARQDVLELAAINARTELLAGTAHGECSVIARSDGGQALLAQTWDWHPDLAGATLTWTVHQDGRWFTTITEAGILGKLGCNSRGLACGLNFLASSEDGGTDGVPVHVLLRLVLERCAGVEDALALLHGTRPSASACITLAERATVVAAELSPGGVTVVHPDAGGWLVHTNHFLAGPATGADTLRRDRPGTVARRELLVELLQRGVPVLEALASHAPAEEPVCRHDDPPGTPWAERRATLLALAVDPAAGELLVAPGPPCSNGYARV
jgi:isopenicillin-N N-acyltransferase-like protein